MLGLSAQLKSGNYAFKSGITPYEVLQKIARGDVTLKRLSTGAQDSVPRHDVASRIRAVTREPSADRYSQ